MPLLQRTMFTFVVNMPGSLPSFDAHASLLL